MNAHSGLVENIMVYSPRTPRINNYIFGKEGAVIVMEEMNVPYGEFRSHCAGEFHVMKTLKPVALDEDSRIIVLSFVVEVSPVWCVRLRSYGMQKCSS